MIIRNNAHGIYTFHMQYVNWFSKIDPVPPYVHILQKRITLHSTPYTLHSTLHTLNSTLYTLHFTLHTLHSTIYTFHSALYTPDFTLQTLHSTLYTPTLHSTLHIPHSALYTPHSTLYTLNSTLYTFHITLCTPHSTLHIFHPTPCTLHSTLHNPHFTLYTLHSPLNTSLPSRPILCTPPSSAFHSLQCTGTVTGEKMHKTVQTTSIVFHILYIAHYKLGPRLTAAREIIWPSWYQLTFFHRGSSAPNAFCLFWPCRIPCHWEEQFHSFLLLKKALVLLFLRCRKLFFSQEGIQPLCFFKNLRRCVIISLGEQGKTVWRHVHCWIIRFTSLHKKRWPSFFSTGCSLEGCQDFRFSQTRSLLFVSLPSNLVSRHVCAKLVW